MSTALARQTPPQDAEAPRTAVALPEGVQTRLAERKAAHAVMAQVASMNWGKSLSPETQRAVAAYLRATGTDITEIDVLGDRIYRNANWYLRKLAEMTAAGEIEWHRAEWVNDDPRLYEETESGDAEMQAWARSQLAARRRERILRNIPEAADAACVVYIKATALQEVVSDAKWHVPGARRDPVGDANPSETVLTRAYRRAMRFLARHIAAFSQLEKELDDRAAEAGIAIREIREREWQVEAEHRRALPPGGHPLLDSEEPYGEPRELPFAETPRSQPAAVVTPAPVTDAQLQRAREAATEPDEYEEQGTLVEEPEKVHTARRVDMPKGGKVADALELNDRPRGRRNAVAEGQ